MKGDSLLFQVRGQLLEGGGVEDAFVDEECFHGIAGGWIVTLGITNYTKMVREYC